MQRIAGIALGLLVATGAHAQATPAGLWKQVDDETKAERSLVRIGESGGVYSGKVEKILDPARADARCEACTGELKDKPIAGLTIIRGVRQNPTEPGVYDGGEILDPNNGKTYKLKMTPADGGKTLILRGYIGISLLGRSQTWTRVE